MRVNIFDKKFFFPLFYLIFMSAAGVGGEELYFEKRDFSTLTIPSVSSICEDNRGYIWVGTPGGLLRYDSRKPLLISRKDNPGLASDHILSLAFSTETEKLWVGTERGLFRYSLAEDTFKKMSFRRRHNQNINSEIHSVVAIPSPGVFAVSGDTIFRLTDAGFMDEVPVEASADQADPGAFKLAAGENGELWAIASDGLKRWNERDNVFSHILSIDGGLNLSVIDNDIWIGTDSAGAGLIRYSPGNHEVQNYPVNGNITSITSDPAGKIWAGSENNGLFIINPGTSVVQSCDLDPEHPYKLPSSRIESLFRGNSGHVWIGTADTGLLSVDIRKSNHLKYIRRAGSNSLPTGSVQAVFEDSLGYLWIGSHIGGLARLDPVTGDIQQYTHNPGDYFSIISDNISGIVEDGTGRLWIGTDKGPVIYLPEVDGFEPAGIMMSGWKDFQGQKVLALAQGLDGSLWISFQQGDLYRLNSQEQESSDLKYPPFSVPGVLLVDRQGILWAGSSRNLRLFNMKGQLIKTWPAVGTESGGVQEGGITEIFSDSLGRIWLGGPLGLSIFMDMNEGFRSLKLPDGHCINVSGISEDEEGNIWVSEGRQIQIFNSDMEFICTMGAEAGFTPSGLVTSLHKARNGTMYVGSNSELWNYSSYVSAAIITPPEVNLTELRVMNEVVASGYNLNGLTSKHLHSDEKIFRVSFEAVDYRYQGEISYQYRLMGLSDIWVNNGQNDSVTFANLAPGEYLFSVRAVNEFGDFSEKEACIKIVVEKSYWQRTPALIMYVVIAAALFLTFLKMWEGRLMKAQISELEEARMKVVEANKKLSFLTMSDSLTGLLNRRGFDRGIAQALATAQRNSLMITLYMLDVDFFKLYNDNYGHVKGDEVLRGVGKALRQVFGRSTDIIARYGGEEFAVVFVGENPNASVTLANDLILAVKELGIVHEFSSVSGLLTLSAGSATIRVGESDTVERLIQRADDALYAAKEGGRNRICFTGVIPELPGRMKSGLKPLVIDEGDT